MSYMLFCLLKSINKYFTLNGTYILHIALTFSLDKHKTNVYAEKKGFLRQLSKYNIRLGIIDKKVKLNHFRRLSRLKFSKSVQEVSIKFW